MIMLANVSIGLGRVGSHKMDPWTTLNGSESATQKSTVRPAPSWAQASKTSTEPAGMFACGARRCCFLELFSVKKFATILLTLGWLVGVEFNAPLGTV